MEYTIKAIPTAYKGVRFRSRLEARWAAMFDKLGWHWRYEPLDLDGWIPDFIVNDSLMVEIKPILWAGVSGPLRFVYGELEQKIAPHGGIVLGADLLCGDVYDTHRGTPIGVLISERTLERFSVGLVKYADGRRTGQRLRCAPYHSDYADLMFTDRKRTYDALEYMWNEAGNAVQYQHKSRA